MREELIKRAVELEQDIRKLDDFTHEDRKAAQSVSQCAASLEEAVAKLNIMASLNHTADTIAAEPAPPITNTEQT